MRIRGAPSYFSAVDSLVLYGKDFSRNRRVRSDNERRRAAQDIESLGGGPTALLWFSQGHSLNTTAMKVREFDGSSNNGADFGCYLGAMHARTYG